MTNKMQKEANPRFTVIIPTKNRADFLYHSLRTCMMQDYDNLEIIVADDSSTDNTKEIVLEASRLDSRVHYIQNTMGSGMRDNFEGALAKVKPGYVIALGGDDGLLPNGIIGMRDALAATGLQLLTWQTPSFKYPGVFGQNGQLLVYRPKKDKIIKSSDFLRKQTDHLYYVSDIESPMFYVKGVASTTLIDKVRSRTKDGRFYSCPTPDGYSGIVLAGEVEHYAFSGMPFSIHGTSPQSQGLLYIQNGDNAKENSEQFYKKVDSIPMHQDLASQPYSPLITLMTVDYLMTAKELPGWPGVVPAIDFKKVLRYSISELSHGLYGKERLLRELIILKAVATHHNLDSYFNDLLRKSRRKKEKVPFEGTGISPRCIFLDGMSFNFRNIVDASYGAYNIYGLMSNLNPRGLYTALIRSLKYYFSTKGKGEPFPVDFSNI
ncbi:glycosyltransferase family 2 protein [Legionella sainthelensi]|uniref:glycosyltransferase family 2 protein n=1 Tax=Legionella sainthelensi TaxID=28087 RepID=UPI000E1FF9B0|nr:glycosyltransferase family A protein [Legionella sainthelensi]